MAVMSTIRERDAEWAALTPMRPAEQHGAMWTREGLADAYFDACYDRLVLLAALDVLVEAAEGLESVLVYEPGSALGGKIALSRVAIAKAREVTG
jgi:hypothetical protein